MFNKSIVSAVILTLVGLLAAVPLVQARDWLSVHGYYKSYFTAYDWPDIDFFISNKFDYTKESPVYAAVDNHLRLKATALITDRLSLTGAYDFSPRAERDTTLNPVPSWLASISTPRPGYRVDDIRQRLFPEPGEPVGNFSIYQNLDRLFLTVNSRFADLYIGRQAIAWGSARVINPTDVFAPYTFNELDVEDRIGVDAVRLRMPIGSLSEIDAGYVLGDDFESRKSAMFLRGKFNYRRSDISLMAVGFRENLMIGLDVTRPIGGAGFWFEGAYVFDKALKSDERDSDYDFFRGTIGCDYSLRDGTYLFIEYHYNGAGVNDIEHWFEVVDESAYLDASGYLFGKHYLAPGVNYQLTPLIMLGGQLLVNLNDPSLFIMPTLECNIAENIYLSGGAYMGFGGSAEYNMDIEGMGPGEWSRLKSEFGNYPDYYFTSFRIYF